MVQISRIKSLKILEYFKATHLYNINYSKIRIFYYFKYHLVLNVNINVYSVKFQRT